MADNSPTLALITNPEEFFRERVTEARSSLSLQLEEEIEFYIVNLLCEFIDPSKILIDQDKTVLDQPLALMLKDAMEAPSERKTGLFKRMGDVSLYIAGYFQDYFNRKTFDIKYFIDMGRSAYANASVLMRDRYGDQHFCKVYDVLSEKFPEMVEVVAIVSDSSANMDSNDNLLATYDRWNQTKSERLRRRLAANGISPISVTRKAQ